MFHEIGQMKIRLTGEVARQFAEMPGLPGERPLRLRHVRALAQKVHNGTFYSPAWARVLVGKVSYRVNGQHSAHMLSALDGAFPKGLNVLIRDFRADTMTDAADLFCQFDTKLSTRSRGDAANVHGSGHRHANIDHVSPTDRVLCNSAIAYGLHDGEGMRAISDEDRGRYLTEQAHREFVLWADEFLGPKHLRRAVVIAAIFRTYAHCPGEAQRFWRWVRDGSHSSKHPSGTLERFLLQNKATGSVWSPRAFYVKCLIAWNAYRQGRTTTLRYYPNAPVPKVL